MALAWLVMVIFFCYVFTVAVLPSSLHLLPLSFHSPFLLPAALTPNPSSRACACAHAHAHARCRYSIRLNIFSRSRL